MFLPSKTLKAYKGQENDNFKNLLVWNTLQFLGQFKKNIFSQKRLVLERDFLNVGCGDNLYENFVNIDCHGKRSLISFKSDKIFRWDLRKKLPFDDNTFKGVYSEHCLEHLNPNDSFFLISELCRVLKPGGIARIIVPDAERYVDYYNRKKEGKDTTEMANFNGWNSGGEALRGLTCFLGHYTLYDYELMKASCVEVGFSKVMNCSFRGSKIKELNQDDPNRIWNSLYVEATK